MPQNAQGSEVAMSYLVLARSEYDKVWDRFYDAFKFKPDCCERRQPAILEPAPSVVYQIRSYRADSEINELEAFFSKAFQKATPPGGLMYALDWHHECYKFLPHDDWSDLPIGVYPNGDYYIFLGQNLDYGTFGHPWQSTLCVFGESLVRLAQVGPPAILESVVRTNP